MIQRVQSIYLFLAVLNTGLVMWFVPLFKVGEKIEMINQYPIFLILFLLSAALSLFTIFRYKKRQHQVMAGRLNITLDFVLFGLILSMYFTNFKSIEASLSLASFLPLISVVFTTLANRAIMRDEAVVKAANRFR